MSKIIHTLTSTYLMIFTLKILAQIKLTYGDKYLNRLVPEEVHKESFFCDLNILYFDMNVFSKLSHCFIKGNVFG